MENIGIIGLIFVVCTIFAAGWLSKRPAAPARYQRKVKTGAPIEKKYMGNGPYKVSVKENAVLQEFKKFIVYYPQALESENRKFPVIVLCNGTGVPLSKYRAVAAHLASWGFVVIGTEEKYSWNGFGAGMCLRYLERLSRQVGQGKSIFYQKIDFDHVGICGHSQGAVGVMNAAEQTGTYKAAAAISPSNRELARNLMWDYDASRIHTPVLLLSGAGGGDDLVVTGEQLKEIYDEIPAEKWMARRIDTDHGRMLYSANGYVTAWFMWKLQNDLHAARAFTGNDPEIMNNLLYTDQHEAKPDQEQKSGTTGGD